MKTASKEEVKQVAEALLDFAIEPVRIDLEKEIHALVARLTGLQAQVSGQDRSLHGKAPVRMVEDLAQRMSAQQRAQEKQNKDMGAGLQWRGDQLADIRKEMREIGKACAARAIENRDALQDVKHEVAAQTKLTAQLWADLNNLKKTADRVLTRLTELEGKRGGE